MPTQTTAARGPHTLFDLPARLAAKAAPRRIADDEEQLHRIDLALEAAFAATERELTAVLSRRATGRRAASSARRGSTMPADACAD